ncbi:hypothetical protein niasHT_013003 [Heterodera trifolii]|uniref:Peptidase C1A papain C-terminal domain-containing protein n=1 Tax=Heterodera trifolii TaxID=157864 RepID=A0ABD2L3P1_9BILA
MRCFFSAIVLLIVALLLLEVVLCKKWWHRKRNNKEGNNGHHKKSSSSSSSSSSADSSDSSESDEDKSKSAELLTDQGRQKRRSRALSRVAKCNERSSGLWRAILNERFAMMSDTDKKRMAGLLIIGNNGTLSPIATTPAAQIPAQRIISKRRRKRATCTATISFDARQQWPACAAIINKVQDQSKCGDCWAVATASVYNDRYCINRVKKGQSTDANSASSYVSSLDIMSCSPNSFGCDGGSPYYAWDWIQSTGVVSGTDYPTKNGCKPYPFEPKARTRFTTPSCSAKCSNSAWKTAYTADRKFASATDFLQDDMSTVSAIKNEIKTNGPVVASMIAYNDLYYYSTGVYTRTSNTNMGGHAVRLIGWGKQKCTDGTSQDFWIAVNSWNTDWGQKGIFYIAKGVDEVGIERMGIFWGTPKV